MNNWPSRPDPNDYDELVIEPVDPPFDRSAMWAWRAIGVFLLLFWGGVFWVVL